jgi:hypothetical protein
MLEKVPAVVRPELHHTVPRRRREQTTLAAVSGHELLSTSRAAEQHFKADPAKVLKLHAPRPTNLVRAAANSIDLSRIQKAEEDLSRSMRAAAESAPFPQQPTHSEEMEIMAEQALMEEQNVESSKYHGTSSCVVSDFFQGDKSGHYAAQTFFKTQRPYEGQMAIMQPSKTTAYGKRLR